MDVRQSWPNPSPGTGTNLRVPAFAESCFLAKGSMFGYDSELQRFQLGRAESTSQTCHIL